MWCFGRAGQLIDCDPTQDIGRLLAESYIMLDVEPVSLTSREWLTCV